MKGRDLVLAVYLCEDNQEQLAHYADVVKRYIMINDYDMEIRLATPSPQALLKD